MLNYDLAKQLKDSGFPQGDLEKDNYYSKVGIFKQGIAKEFPKEAIYIPYLYELIAECGDVFWSLSREQDGWWVRKNNRQGKDFNGKSPEDVVACLYLELKR